MNKRKYALSILKQARDLLTERMIESIVESADGILEDAEGYSYMDEIDAIQDKIGGRLSSINSMIANFPPESPSDPQESTQNETRQASALNQTKVDSPKPEKFALFAEQISGNDLDAAGQTLAGLLNVDYTTGLRCATAFKDRLAEDPSIIHKTMLLRTKLATGKNNDSLMILWDCFRLQGVQAIEVMQTLKAQLASASS